MTAPFVPDPIVAASLRELPTLADLQAAGWMLLPPLGARVRIVRDRHHDRNAALGRVCNGREGRIVSYVVCRNPDAHTYEIGMRFESQPEIWPGHFARVFCDEIEPA